MTEAEIKKAIKAAFNQCQRAFCPLSERQKEIIRQSILKSLIQSSKASENPLDELTPGEKQALLSFIQAQAAENWDWKITLLNDWLNNRDSREVQFIRDKYGFNWLNQVQKIHIDSCLQLERRQNQLLQVGDRIEVCNGLWEWAQDNSPCPPEWFPCVVVGLAEIGAGDSVNTTAIVRFESGAEFEVQGIYQGNKSYWRFPEPNEPN